ncbi:MAG TPA: NAD-binding protein, partial [Microvirga sp.]|nr:NAD-binding protein [Microvirga sp.]
LQDAFAVLFFVSVGMLFDPGILLREPLSVLAVLGIILLGKSLAAVAIVLAFKHPIGTALTIAASLAQIGEFSFILVSLGLSLKLLPTEGRDLILGGAILSITLNPLFFVLAERATRFFAERPELAARFERRGAAAMAVTEEAKPHRGHAIVIGYGRVGSTIAKAFATWDLPYLVIDRDRRRVLDLRKDGVEAVFGDATAPGILEAADIGQAKLIVIASPEPHTARRLVELAREANPGIDTLVRTHNDGERHYFEEQGVGLVLMAERELAFGMTLYALRSLGLKEGEARIFVDSTRVESRTAPVEAEIDQGAPELRPHKADVVEG